MVVARERDRTVDAVLSDGFLGASREFPDRDRSIETSRVGVTGPSSPHTLRAVKIQEKKIRVLKEEEGGSGGKGRVDKTKGAKTSQSRACARAIIDAGPHPPLKPI